MSYSSQTPQQMVMPHSSLKQRLLSGETSYGVLLATGSPIVAEILSFCGYDMVVIDADHSPADTGTCVQILQALGAAGSAGIVRVPENSPLYLKKALDIGPAGIIIPTVDSADAAKRAVSSCKYAPTGIRGYSSPTVRGSLYGLQPDYMRRIEDFPLVIVQIESELAVGRISEIAAVDGIDCIMISPDDIATSMGKFPEQEHEEVQRLVRRAEEAVVTSGKLLGSFTPNSSVLSINEMVMRGYSVVVGASDVALLRDNARADVARARGLTARTGASAIFSAVAGADGKTQGGSQLPGQLLMARVTPVAGGGGLGALSGVGSPIQPGVAGTLSSMIPMPPGAQHGAHPGMPGMQGYTVSRRGGRGTPKRCSHCHMPLKEGHKEDCVAWERKLKMKMKLVEAENPQVSSGIQEREADLAATQSSENKAIAFGVDAQGGNAMVMPSDGALVAAGLQAGRIQDGTPVKEQENGVMVTEDTAKESSPSHDVSENADGKADVTM